MGVFWGEITLAVPDSLLHSLDAFGIEPGMGAAMALEDGGDYDYQGHCPRTGQLYTLPRTALAKAVAQGLMAQLSQTTQPEGKMYGVLLVQAPAGPIAGPIAVLKAFSGLWRGQERILGWVPPMPGRERVARQEAQTLDQLAALKDQLVILQQRPERQTYARWQADWAKERQALNQRHRDRKQGRDRQRQTLASTLTGVALTSALATLEQESRGDKAELRQFKQRQHQALAPLGAAIQAADAEAVALKRQRRDLSRQLQADMQAAYTLTNFAGTALSLQALAPQGGLPTGTGDCCAPKLLHTATQYGLKPLALAEFWWGPAQGDRHPGTFYGACVERCQPILGFMLSGLSARVLGVASGVTGVGRGEIALPILYHDNWIVVVDKPAGLLSVPGRYGDRQDSVLSRLRQGLPAGRFIQPVHRLDQDTSGVLVLALDAESHRRLGQQFEQRHVQKRYTAILNGEVDQPSGLIDLPLWGDPAQRPYQQVSWPYGKPSQTRFEVLSQTDGGTRVAFYLLTGRTHQLRVHAAHPQGLNAPIRGDRLYGPSPDPGQRLHLHAQRLQFTHPHSGGSLTLEAAVPF